LNGLPCRRGEVSACLLVFFLILSAGGCSRVPELAQRDLPHQPEVAKPGDSLPEPTPLERWQELVRKYKYASVNQKLMSVNAFFNQFEFAEDRNLWGTDDYWATLSETLRMSAGDCEDFTIAKYFTLRELNIPQENMRLTYVISLKTKQPHMVLTLHLDPSRDPIVLDSENNSLLPVSMRQDLVPVFSFNAEGYWLAKKDKGWRGERIGSAGNLFLWHDVLERMNGDGSAAADG